MTRVPVILHERLGTWIRQLRPRLNEMPVRWFESRSSRELEALLAGLVFPVVVIDLGRQTPVSLKDVSLVSLRVPSSRILVITAEMLSEVSESARELGATHVVSGLVPPPVVAELLARWISMARQGIERSGWSRQDFPETESDPWNWLSDYLDEPGICRAKPLTTPRRPPYS